MYQVIAYDYLPSFGAWSGIAREIYRSDSRAECDRICQTIRRKARKGEGYQHALYFMRHVRRTSTLEWRV